MFWRVLRWTIISVLILVVLLGATVGIVLNIVFTPEKLTPIVEKYANEYLDADVRFKSIDLTFYSTFPNFGIDIEDGSMETFVAEANELASGNTYEGLLDAEGNVQE